MRVGRITGGVAAGGGCPRETAGPAGRAAVEGTDGPPSPLRRALRLSAAILEAALPHLDPGTMPGGGGDPVGRLLLQLPRPWRAPAIIWFAAACLLIRAGRADLAAAVVLAGLAAAAAWMVWRQAARDLRRRRARRAGAA